MSDFRKLAFKFKFNFWVIPSTVIAVIILFTLGLMKVDQEFAQHPNYLQWLSWYQIGPSGAREIFNVIATSMITVSSIIFSVTILALAQASTQISPRVLHHFMGNRYTQMILGIIVGIFIFCLLVLQEIHSGQYVDEYVPKLATIFGIFLAIIGIGFLISFIYHIANLLQASTIIAQISKTTLQAVNELLPNKLICSLQNNLTANKNYIDDEANNSADWTSIPALATGYIQHYSLDQLVKIATKLDTQIKLVHRVGAFVIKATAILKLKNNVPLSPHQIKNLRSIFVIDSTRAIHNDISFGIQQLVDITNKSLSTSNNDTTTAITAIDHISWILSELIQREFPNDHIYVQDQLRVIAKNNNFATLLDIAICQIRQNALGNVTIIIRLLRTLEMLCDLTEDQEDLTDIASQADAIAQMAKETVQDSSDLNKIEAKIKTVKLMLSNKKKNSSNEVSKSKEKL